MNKIDISKKNLYFKKMINVLTTKIINQKPIHVSKRHSDAFVFVITGSCTYTFPDDGYSVTASEGDILYLAHNAVYVMNVHTKKYQSIYCDFEFNLDTERKSDVFSPQNSSNAENLFYKLLKCYTTPCPTSFSECMSILYTIHGIILMTANSTYIERSAKNKISEIKKYIDENFKDDSLSVSMIAKKTAISEVYLRKLFKSQYGISPSQYIISVRIKKAKELMKYPFLTLEECALQSGFSSLQYFCRVFKKATNITPSQYRKQK